MNTRGFALLAALVMSVVMAIAATVILSTANDLLLGARAMRTSAAAQAAAEYGLDQTENEWPNWAAMLPGEVLDLPDALVPDMAGAFYEASVLRTDDDSTGTRARSFLISVTGYDIGGGTKDLTLFVMNDYTLLAGLATSSAGTVRGDVDVQGGALITGIDSDPPEWSGVCGPTGADRPGLTMNDTLLLDDSGGSTIGMPPVAQVALNDSLLSYFGELAWDDLLALPHVVVVGAAPRDLVGCPVAVIAAELCGVNEIGPRYNADGTCDQTHELNWGSNNPADACFDHFPIIEIREEVDVNNCPGPGGLTGGCNGIFVLASDTTGGVRAGAELDVELNVDMRGPIFGRGCVEFQQGAQYHGSVFVDGTYDFGECNDDATLDVHDAGTRVGYSSCAIRRALLANGLGVPTLTFEEVRPIASRAWGEPIR